MHIAVLGCGSIGRRHLRNLQALGYTDLVAFDPSAASREAALQETGVKGYEKLDDIWGFNPDVVLVTSPSNLHTELALAAARHGAHLFIEKPLSHSFENLSTLAAEVEQSNLITMVGCNMRFHPGPAQVKKLISENAVGKVIAARIQTGSYLPGWRPQTDYRLSYSASPTQGGAILDCIHEIDLALWYLGAAEVVSAVSLPAESLGIEVEGLVEILLRHHSGALSNVHLNYIQRDYKRACQIIGTEGTIYWDFTDGEVRVYTPAGEWEITKQSADWTVNQMYIDEMTYFMNCVVNHTPTFSDVQQGIAALQVALTAKHFSSKVTA
ncbi:MAG: Gfo/Idh/MocA family oxidoreductase [Chloroflexota bacterium]